MKKLLFYSDSSSFGGAETYLADLVNAFTKKGFNVSLIAIPSFFSKFKINNSITAYKMMLSKSVFDLVQLLRMRKILNELQPDILHINFGTVYSAIPLLLLNFPKRCKVIASVHSYRLPDSKYPLIAFFRKMLVRYILSKIERFILTSEYSKNEFCRLYGITEDKVNVIYNGLADEEEVVEDNEIMRKYQIKSDEKIVGLVSRLVNFKGLECFIEAIDILEKKGNHAKYLIVGDGYLRDKLQRKSASVSKNIIFVGHIENTGKFIKHFDVGVFCSESENFPYVILEYMRAAIPIVSTNVGGIPEMVRHMEEALLVPKKMPNMIADSIRKILNNNKLARDLSAQARQRYEANFKDHVMISKTIEVINQ